MHSLNEHETLCQSRDAQAWAHSVSKPHNYISKGTPCAKKPSAADYLSPKLHLKKW